MTDDHSTYSVRHSTNSIYREITYNGLFDLNLSFRKKNELDFKPKFGYCGFSVIP